ncbi:MAG TPA: AAA family ATPase, partial [Oscillatoriaceae cyanobacterium]
MTTAEVADLWAILQGPQSTPEERRVAAFQLAFAKAPFPDGYQEEFTEDGRKRKTTDAAPGLEDVPQHGRMVVQRGDEVEEEDILWLWENRIARRKFTLIAGEQGLGKSQLTMAMAAHVTTGKPWPDCPNEPRDPAAVVFLSAEDDLGDTVIPRAIA